MLYNGKKRWSAERQFRNLLNHEQICGSKLLNFEYLLIDVARYTEEELLSLSNTIGSVFLLDQTKDQAQFLERFGKLMHTILQLPDDEPHLQEFIQNVAAMTEASTSQVNHVFGDCFFGFLLTFTYASHLISSRTVSKPIIDASEKTPIKFNEEPFQSSSFYF